MFGYCYDKETLEFTERIKLDADPEESKLRGVFVPLVPACCTLEPCTMRDGFTARFENGGWVHYIDFRGRKQVEVSTGLESDVRELGDLAEGFMFSEDYYVSDIYLDKVAQAEHQALQMSSMTKYDFYKYVLKPLGITYEMLKQVLDEDENMKIAWELCERIYRGDETLNSWLKSVPLTSAELDDIFREYGS